MFCCNGVGMNDLLTSLQQYLIHDVSGVHEANKRIDYVKSILELCT
jgi:hypothetical protein